MSAWADIWPGPAGGQFRPLAIASDQVRPLAIAAGHRRWPSPPAIAAGHRPLAIAAG